LPQIFELKLLFGLDELHTVGLDMVQVVGKVTEFLDFLFG
jgi:hypothetical protein